MAFDANRLLHNILGVEYTGSGLGDALDILRADRQKQAEIKHLGGYTFDKPVMTNYGLAGSTIQLEDFANRARMEREEELRDLAAYELSKQQGNPVLNLQDAGVQLGTGYGAPGGEVLGAQSAYIPPVDSGFGNIGQFASDWYSSVGHPQQADEAALIAEKAVQYGVDPYMALALAAQEGGWARYYPETSPYNYFGWGVTDSGDLGMAGESLGGWLDEYMPDIATQYGGRNRLTDWGGSLQGYGAGSQFGDRYNYNDSWVEALASLVNQAEAYRQANFPDLTGTRMVTAY